MSTAALLTVHDNLQVVARSCRLAGVVALACAYRAFLVMQTLSKLAGFGVVACKPTCKLLCAASMAAGEVL
jgi:hypothetical protein